MFYIVLTTFHYVVSFISTTNIVEFFEFLKLYNFLDTFNKLKFDPIY